MLAGHDSSRRKRAALRISTDPVFLQYGSHVCGRKAHRRSAVRHRVWYDCVAEGHKAPEVLAMNPRGQVPVFKDGDTVVSES